MKNLVILIALIGLTTTTLATTNLEDLGVGWCFNCVTETSSPHYFTLVNSGYIDFMFEYAGSGTLHLGVNTSNAGTSVNYSVMCYSENFTQSTNQLSQQLSGSFVGNASFPAKTYGDINYDSNIGVVRCSLSPAAGQVQIFLSGDSYVTYGTQKYTSFNAGENNRLQAVNRWYNSTGYASTPHYTYAVNPINGVMEMIARNVSLVGSPVGRGQGLMFNQFFPSCSISGLQNYVFWNWEGGAGIGVQTYYQTLNISPYNASTITGFNYEENSTQIFSNDISLNLSVSISNPAVIDWIVWYVDGNIYSASTGSTHAQINLTKRATPYHIEVQLEDNDCGIQNATYYPTTGFYASVGQYITLHGITYGRQNGVISNLPSVSLALNSSSQRYDTESSGNGSYIFTGILPGTYTLLSTKNFYSPLSETLTFTVVGEDPETIYGHDLVLNWSNVTTPQYTYALDCNTNITNLDVVCCVQTNNPGIYFLSVLGYGQGGNQQFALDMYGSDCISFIEAGETVYCSQTYEAYIGGVGSNTTDSVITNDCFATTTLYPTTTTTTLLPNSLECSASDTENDIDCYLITSVVDATVLYNIPNETESGGHTFNNPAGGFGFSVVGNLGATAYCNTFYEIWLQGYESQTYQGVYTRQCDGTPQTTTTVATTTTTTIIPQDCDINHYDFNKNCRIDNNELIFGTNDYIDGRINYSCFSIINYYSLSQNQIEGCIVVPTTQIGPTTTLPGPAWTCSNLTGKIHDGDVVHASMCAYVIPLGPTWTFGLSIFFIVIAMYRATRTWVVPGIITLLFTSLFYAYMPQPGNTILGLGVGVGLGLLLLSYYLSRTKEPTRRGYNYDERDITNDG